MERQMFLRSCIRPHHLEPHEYPRQAADKRDKVAKTWKEFAGDMRNEALTCFNKANRNET
jgi:hypothetical protein